MAHGHRAERRRATGLVLVALLLVAVGCSKGGSTSSGAKTESSASDTSATQSSFGPNDDDAIIEKAISDVQSFYADEFTKLYGGTFPPLSGGEFPYGPADPPPECGGTGTANYEEVAANAFYCPEGDFVAWDTDNLTNDLLTHFGPYTLAIVVAHELGHAIQARHGVVNTLAPFVSEQQADCFAGAYTAHVREGGSKAFQVSLDDLDNAIGGFLQIRDPLGTDPRTDESAHGSAFQRINAFEDGLDGGMEKCKTYEDLAFDFVPDVFVPGSIDQARKGNLPFGDVEPLVIKNLEGFWTVAFPRIADGDQWRTAKTNPFDPRDGVTCDQQTFKGDTARDKYLYCAKDDTMSWDDVELMPQVHDTIGDLAQATIIAKLYSQRAQHLAGLPTGTVESGLQTDCFTGVWVATLKTDEVNQRLPQDAVVQLSPGDLDEVVAAFLRFGAKPADVKSGKAPTGTAFQRLSAFRTGFFEAFDNGLANGLQTCRTADLSASSSSSSSGSSSSSS